LFAFSIEPLPTSSVYGSIGAKAFMGFIFSKVFALWLKLAVVRTPADSLVLIRLFYDQLTV
jgi:hypothetical protein